MRSSHSGFGLGEIAKTLLLLVLFLWVTGVIRTPGQAAAAIGKPAPLFEGKSADAGPVSLGSLKGKVVVLDFWATWCPPCRQAIPHVQALHKRFASKPVAVMGVNLDVGQSPEQIRDFLLKNSISFTQMLDGGKVAQMYGVEGIPCAVVIDRGGILRNIHTGYSDDLERELGEDIEKLL